MKKYLSKEDRTIIEWELKKNSSCRKIAKLLNKHHSTIIYEVKKNSFRGKYMASKANELNKERKSKRGSKLKMSLH
jgi:IS30 family transposase